MNKLRNNPNVRRFGLPLALTAILLRGAACTSNTEQPLPSETSASATGVPVRLPSCAIEAEVSGLVVAFDLDVTNGSQQGVYGIEKAEYTYGDGASEASGSVNQQSHTYAQAGSYAVNASLIMDVAPGADVGAPFRDGFRIPCFPTIVTVG